MHIYKLNNSWKFDIWCQIFLINTFHTVHMWIKLLCIMWITLCITWLLAVFLVDKSLITHCNHYLPPNYSTNKKQKTLVFNHQGSIWPIYLSNYLVYLIILWELSVILVTITAIDWSVISWNKRNSGRTATVCTYCIIHLSSGPIASPVCLSCITARFATDRFILETSLCIEFLFPGSKNKTFTAISTY